MTTFPHAFETSEDAIRERAYFLWLDQGCPHGNDWEHWFTAKEQLIAGIASPEPAKAALSSVSSPHFSIARTVAAHEKDPAHRFHAPGAPHDSRLDVVAGEARQRVRGRHFDSSLRAKPKKRR